MILGWSSLKVVQIKKKKKKKKNEALLAIYGIAIFYTTIMSSDIKFVQKKS